MNFTDTIKSETADKYKRMLNRTSDIPFSETPSIASSSNYSNNRDNYYKRLNKEKNEFNEALKKIIANRDRRLTMERYKARQRARCRYNWWKAIKTIIFLLPMVLCIIIGCDVFDESHGHIYKIEALDGFSVGGAVALYVIYCIVTVICSITFIVKMYRNEHFESGVKRYSVWAILVLIFLITLIAINIYNIIINESKYAITYVGGKGTDVVDIERGKTITLSTSSKSDVDNGTYVTKYTFTGWLINGELYEAHQTYQPTGDTVIEAQFSSTDWATISISTSAASITLEYNGKTETPSHGNKIEIEVGTSVTASATFSYSATTFHVGDATNVESPYTFILREHTLIHASSEKQNCLVEGTLITLYDGTKKLVEDLTAGDILAVFNHETGKYEAAPLLANIHAYESADYYRVINLTFSDGTSLRIVNEHGLFDKTLNKYVYIREDNISDFIGHTFVATDITDNGIESRFVELISGNVTEEYVKIYNPASVWHINVIANNMLTLSAGMVNLFEYADNMQYDLSAMEQDIETYGLYTYDDFKDYVSIDVYEAFPFKYYKVAVEKGEFTFEQILELIEFYNNPDTVK